MSTANTFQDLEVWKKSHELTLAVYKATEGFPKHELYGLTSQMRRAAVSVSANIAEGFKKRSPADKARFFNISQGSLEEVRYFTILSRDLGYCTGMELFDLVENVSKPLFFYIKSILE